MAQQLNWSQERLIVEVSRPHAISQTHTHTHTHTAGSIPLNEGSARRRGRYLHSTQQAQDTNIHALSGIRTRDPSKQASAFVRLDRAAAEICLP